MNNKPYGRRLEDQNDADYLRTAVTELNESIALLSKMVVQLQKSLNEHSKSESSKRIPSDERPKILH